MRKTTQAEDGGLDEILLNLWAVRDLAKADIDLAIAKDKILSLKSKWQAEVRQEMLKKLPEKFNVTTTQSPSWVEVKKQGFDEAIDLMRKELEQ